MMMSFIVTSAARHVTYMLSRNDKSFTKFVDGKLKPSPLEGKGGEARMALTSKTVVKNNFSHAGSTFGLTMHDLHTGKSNLQ